jgi:LysM repeat protein
MDVDSSSKSGPSTMVPIAIGLVGVLLAAIALFMAISNGSTVTSKINDLSAKVDDASTKAGAAAGGLQDLDAKVKMNTDNITAMRSSVQDFITQAGAVIQKQGQEIADLQSSKSVKGATTAKGAKGATASESSGPGGSHTVASGETFSTIARKYGVSVAAIEAANPGVESSKLKIGQKINLPGKASSAASAAPTPVTPAPEPVTPAASTP